MPKLVMPYKIECNGREIPGVCGICNSSKCKSKKAKHTCPECGLKSETTVCFSCDGTGEGSHGGKCFYCHGSGEVIVPREGMPVFGNDEKDRGINQEGEARRV